MQVIIAALRDTDHIIWKKQKKISKDCSIFILQHTFALKVCVQFQAISNQSNHLAKLLNGSKESTQAIAPLIN